MDMFKKTFDIIKTILIVYPFALGFVFIPMQLFFDGHYLVAPLWYLINFLAYLCMDVLLLGIIHVEQWYQKKKHGA